MKKVLITGAGGLIGLEAVACFCKKGRTVIGVENHMCGTFLVKVEISPGR